MITELKLYIEVIEHIKMYKVKKMLQVGLSDTVFGPLMTETFITLYPNFKLDLLLLDSDDVNEIPSGIYTHVYREKDEIKSDYDVTLVLDALDKREKSAGYVLIDELLKATTGYILVLTNDDMFSQVDQWSIVDLCKYDISYYGIQIDNLKKSLFKIYKTEFETPFEINKGIHEVAYRPLKITYVMPHKILTGGLKMLYEQMKHLQKRGHQIQVVLRGEFEKVVPEWVEDFTPDEEKIIRMGTKYLDVIKDSDIVFSGFINQLEELENNKIPVLYWEQGHETLYGDVSNRNNEKYNRELLAKLYGADVYLASDSEYVQKIMRAKFNKDSYVLPNFIDTTAYYPLENTEFKEILTILLVGNPLLKFKGFEKALSVLVKLWNEGKRFKVVWAGQIKPSISPLPFDIKFYENVSQTELTQVYREADILLSCSMYEGCPMPPLEAIASGVAVVATNCGGINQYAKHQINALISKKGNVEELASYVSLLLENHDLRHELIEQGLITTQELNYEKGELILEEMLLRVTTDYKNRISLRFPNEKIKILFMIGTLGGGGAEKVLTTIVQNLNPNVFDITIQTMYDTGIYIDEVKEHATYKSIYKTIAYSQEEADQINKRHEYLNSLDNESFSKEVIDDVYDIEVAFLEDLSTRVIAYSPNKNSKKIAWVHLDLMADNSVANVFRSEDEQKNCYYNFDEIICVSESAKKGFIDKFGIEENVKVIYNPLDEKVIIKKSFEKIFDQDVNEKFRIVTIGRLLPQKGYDQLLIIHKQLISEGYDYELLILGDGPLKDQYNNFIVENNLTDSVHFMGFKENPYKYLKSGDLFVCSSRNEGFSLVVAEALILGVPIISTNCTGPNELLDFGKYGMLVENNAQSLYEGIKELLSHTITYAHYKKQAQKRGTFFNLKKTMKQIESLFTDIMHECNIASHLEGSKIKVTVFTPTFNRAYRLDKLYNSLREQTCFDFEWLVIDDGSTDHTSQLFDEWINDENKFKITYLKIKNGGKHRAINKGTDLAKGKLFFIVDSDDYLVENTIERVIYWESTIENKTNFAGVSGNRGYSNNEIIGQTFAGEYIDGTSLEREQLNINGDKAEVFYTHVLQNYKFPEIEGENFITENVVWNHIAYDGYKIRWFNEITYITEYLDDGLTKNAYSIALKNPKGYQLANRMNKKFYESISNLGSGE